MRAHADVITFDPAAVTQQIQILGNDIKAYGLQLKQYATQAQQYAQQNLQWVKQVQQYALQAQQYENELQMFMNFYHNPSLGSAIGLLSAAGLSNELPFNPYAVLGLVNGLQYGGGGFSQIGGLLSSLSAFAGTSYATNHVYTPTDGSWASQQIIARGNGIAGSMGVAEATYQDLKTHQAALQALRDHLSTATDTKDVLDTTAQINLETTWTVNESAQLQAVTSAYHAQSDSIVQRDNEKIAQDLEAFLAANPNK